MRALTLTLALLLLGCPSPESTPDQPEADEPAAQAQPLTVVATSFPAAYLVQRVGGDGVVVDNILPAGEDAPHYTPSAEAIGKAQQAGLVVANGAGFEGWMAAATLPADTVVYSAAGQDLIEVEGATHSHGGAGEHSHAGTDPHTWAAPPLYAAQAKVVHDALVKASPPHVADFGANLAALQTELTALDQAYAAALAPAAGLKLAANHPAWEYLERQYGLDILSLDLAPDAAPSQEAVAQVGAWADGVERPIMLWESQPSEEVAAALPEGIEHVVVDPLEQPGPGGSYDYVAQANANVEVFLGLFHTEEQQDAGE